MKHEWKYKKSDKPLAMGWECKTCKFFWYEYTFNPANTYRRKQPPLNGCQGKKLFGLNTTTWKDFFIFYNTGVGASSIYARLGGYDRHAYPYPKKEIKADTYKRKKIKQETFEAEHGPFQGAVFYPNGEVEIYTKSDIIVIYHNLSRGGEFMRSIKKTPKFLKK